MLRHHPPVRPWLLLLVLGQLGDWLTSFVGIQLGAEESNPVTRGLLGHQGWLFYLGLKCVTSAVVIVLWLAASRYPGRPIQIWTQRLFIALTAYVCLTCLLNVLNLALVRLHA